MFLKTLRIEKTGGLIRHIKFKNGLNLIVDESNSLITGNGVGKTTVLKLIDYCLGGDSKELFVDHESKRSEYRLVKDFLIENGVLVTLTLSNDIENGSDDVVICRNFLNRKQNIRTINGEQYSDEDFKSKLSYLIFPDHVDTKPTFRQLISHNIRYKDERINNTLKTLDKFTTEVEYESLYLFLFGCDYKDGDKKETLSTKLKQERTFKKRLENKQTRNAYETAISLIDSEIEILQEKKSMFNLNEDFEKDLDVLNNLKYDINRLGSIIGRLVLKEKLITEAENDLNAKKAEIDLNQLKLIYKQTSSNLGSLHRSFEELVVFHNKMLEEKAKFISEEIPLIRIEIDDQKRKLEGLLEREKELTLRITASDSFEELESVIEALTTKYRLKGEYEGIVAQLVEVDDNIRELEDQLIEIEKEQFSEAFEKIIKFQLKKFNHYFSTVSKELYAESYAVKHEKMKDSKGRFIYKFSSFNANLSSGKKQGEISCFDMAYILFADSEQIPCLHFILNDKKELMHDNQLVKIAEFANKNNIQFIASILKDKLPSEIDREEFFIIKLSEKDKLFRIENSN
jgi:uncharacterized protein YydD (DUF2326 family)